jgi:hypothetical protein
MLRPCKGAPGAPRDLGTLWYLGRCSDAPTRGRPTTRRRGRASPTPGALVTMERPSRRVHGQEHVPECRDAQHELHPGPRSEKFNAKAQRRKDAKYKEILVCAVAHLGAFALNSPPRSPPRLRTDGTSRRSSPRAKPRWPRARTAPPAWSRGPDSLRAARGSGPPGEQRPSRRRLESSCRACGPAR